MHSVSEPVKRVQMFTKTIRFNVASESFQNPSTFLYFVVTAWYYNHLHSKDNIGVARGQHCECHIVAQPELWSWTLSDTFGEAWKWLSTDIALLPDQAWDDLKWIMAEFPGVQSRTPIKFSRAVEQSVA